MQNILHNRSYFSLKNFLIIFEFELRSFLQNKGDILRQLLYEPVLYVLIFSNALSGLVGGELNFQGHKVQYISFVYPGIIGLQLLRILTQSIYRLTVDSRWGMQALKISAGTGCLAYGLGTLIVPLLILCIQSIVSYIIFRLIGGEVCIQNFFYVLLFGFFCTIFWHSTAIFLGFFSKATQDVIFF